MNNMHTFNDCKVKIEGIKYLLDIMKGISNAETAHHLDSAIQMCDELINEDFDGKEEGVRQS